jgi:uncharacterized protein involved in outer membrane biogenesis
VPRPRTWLIGLAAILVVAIVAVWQVPQYLDWNRYRATLEALATTTLGRPVTIHGPITLNLLPQPVLTAAQVSIGGDAAADVSIRVEALRLRVALWPLLGGRVDARELVLRGPDLRLPWPAEPDALRRHAPAWLAAFSARIENGRLTVGRVSFTGIDATLASYDEGASSASGTARFNGQDWHFTARTTSVGADGAVGLNVTLDGQGKANGLGASIAGQIGPDGTFAGTINSRGGNLALLLPTPPLPFRADGRLTVGSGLVAIDDLALELGGAPATGAVALRVAPNQRLDIALSAGRLDFAAWLPALLDAGTSVGGIDLPTGIDFSTASAELGGGTVQRVHATFDLADGALMLREAEAVLPGNARLHLTGRITRGDGSQQRFEGNAAFDAPVLRTTLRWLEGAAPGLLPETVKRLPGAALQRASVYAHVVADSGEVRLLQLGGNIDDSAVAGSIGFRNGKPPAIVADLSLGYVALDGWLPAWPLEPPHFDAALHLTIDAATLAGNNIRNATIDGTIEDGTISLRHASAVVDRVILSAAGTLGKDGVVSNGAFTLEASDGARLQAALPQAWQATRALWQGPVKLAVQGAGPLDALSLGIRLNMSDASLDARPVVNLRNGQWNGELTVRHPGAPRFVSAIGLPERLGLPNLPQMLGDGSFSLTARLSGTPNTVSAERFEMAAGDVRLAGKIAFDASGALPRVSGQISTDTLSLPLPNGGSNVPMPVGMLHGWTGELGVATGKLLIGSGPELRDVKATIAVTGDALRIEQLSAGLDGGTLTGGGVLNASASPPLLVLQARLNGVAIGNALTGAPVDVKAGSLSSSLDLSASGYSPATVLATLAGHIAVTISNGMLVGFDLPHMQTAMENPDAAALETAAGEALAGGTTAFDELRLAAVIDHGDLVLEAARMKGGSGEANASGDVNLPTQMMDMRIVLRPSASRPVPDIAIRLNGPLDHPQRTPELAGLARFVAERAH